MTNKAAVKWAISTLESNGYSTITHREIVQTAYSVIHKIVTSRENFYLKQTPASTTFSLEPAITRLLENKFQAPVPSVIAVHEELHCFLMKEAGVSLRAYLKTNFQPNLIFEAIKQFTRMQRTVENHLEDFVALGVSDWRKTLPVLYDKLLDDIAVLETEGLRAEEIQRLISLKPQLTEELQLLVQYAVPQTIVQCDFHTNNILIHPDTKKLIFNDLGEVVITHPFFSLHGFLKQAITHHGIKEGDKIYNQLQEACLENWPEFEAMTVFSLTKKLWPLYSALIFYRFMNSLDKDVFKALNAHRPYRLAGFLREYIA
ncbi:phosphotransferase [Legionella sp. CNM-4043-24]|uniref:phosphotransferase n=1 Tax=Legionella sp. CNM-4043-24 TaxID=3421646 RepID=UPI00403ABF53